MAFVIFYNIELEKKLIKVVKVKQNNYKLLTKSTKFLVVFLTIIFNLFL